MKLPQRDTIVAISSPPPDAPTAADGRAVLSRAIVRLSGPQALALAAGVFSCNAVTLSSERRCTQPAQEASYPFSSVRGWRRFAGAVTWQDHNLPAQAYVMRSPHTYTREDIVELHTLALPWLLSSLLERLLTAGARLAQPGEFTRRALENGRITVEQAEAVGALIASRNAAEARVHAARLKSHTHAHRTALRREIEELLSFVEFGLDFSQDEAGVLPRAEVQARLERLRALIEDCRGPAQPLAGGDRAAESAVLTAGLPRILLLGPTNAGKSSLFNRLLRRDAALVSPQPHTTRDTVEATLAIPGAGTAVLIDSAGWAAAPLGAQHAALGTESLRQAAWSATLSAVRGADIILLTLDRAVPLAEQNEFRLIVPALAHARPAALAVIWTKADLPPAAGWSAAASLPLLSAEPPLRAPVCIEVSAVSGAGIAALLEFLAARLKELGAQPRDAYLAAATAARVAAGNAAAALARAGAALAGGHGEDVVAVELREAIHAFWLAEGVLMRHDAVTEAALDRIFSRFCIGK